MINHILIDAKSYMDKLAWLRSWLTLTVWKSFSDGRWNLLSPYGWEKKVRRKPRQRMGMVINFNTEAQRGILRCFQTLRRYFSQKTLCLCASVLKKSICSVNIGWNECKINDRERMGDFRTSCLLFASVAWYNLDAWKAMLYAGA